jgi:hypothetical protein
MSFKMTGFILRFSNRLGQYEWCNCKQMFEQDIISLNMPVYR